MSHSVAFCCRIDMKKDVRDGSRAKEDYNIPIELKIEDQQEVRYVAESSKTFQL